MPSKKNKKSTALQKNAESLKNIPIVCESQVYDKVYYKLETDKKVDRLAALLQMASSKGMTIDKTFDIFKQAFAGYMDKDYNLDMFIVTIEKHDSLKNAWNYGTFGDSITNQLVKNKAIDMMSKLKESNAKEIASAFTSIEKYNKLYNDEYIEKLNGNENNKGVNVNINFGDENDANEYE